MIHYLLVFYYPDLYYQVKDENEQYLNDISEKDCIFPDIDYMILGQHCFFDKDFEWFRQEPYDPKYVKMYVDNVIEGVKLGLYAYIAHPDHIINAHREKDEFMEYIDVNE